MRPVGGSLPDVHPDFEIVGMAASAGGLNALTVVLRGLAHDFPLPIVVVQHLDPRHRSLMAKLLSHQTALHTKEAEAGEALPLAVAAGGFQAALEAGFAGKKKRSG